MQTHTNNTVVLLAGPVTEVILASAVRSLIVQGGKHKLVVIDDSGKARIFIIKQTDELKTLMAFSKEEGEEQTPAAFAAELFNTIRAGGVYEVEQEHDLIASR